jgi:hypothetical protein
LKKIKKYCTPHSWQFIRKILLNAIVLDLKVDFFVHFWNFSWFWWNLNPLIINTGFFQAKFFILMTQWMNNGENKCEWLRFDSCNHFFLSFSFLSVEQTKSRDLEQKKHSFRSAIIETLKKIFQLNKQNLEILNKKILKINPIEEWIWNNLQEKQKKIQEIKRSEWMIWHSASNFSQRS